MFQLNPGSFYRIRRVKSVLGSSTRRKLLAMGFLPGAELLVKRVAPWSGPVQLEINGSCISLRSQEIDQFFELETL